MLSFEHNVVKWCAGTDQLGDADYRVYHAIVQAIYLVEGPLSFNEKELAARCNMTAQRLRKSVASLIALHKIWLRGAHIYNLRVLMELRKTLPDCPEWDLSPDYTLPADLLASEPRKRNAPPRTEIEAAFIRFWNNRAKRKGSDPRKPCEDRYAALLASGVTVEAIEAGMKRHVATLRSSGELGTKFTPMTRTWLNGHGFRDDPPQSDKQNVVPLDPARFTADEWAPILKTWRMTNDWRTAIYGPEPGRPGCLVPGELLEPKRSAG